MIKNEEYGPDQACADTIDGDASTQAALYAELKLYNLTDDLNRTTDYFKVYEREGVTYYSPNDEEWGAVIAISEADELALYTGFYETDDFEHPDSDYHMVVHNGMLMCKFQVAR